MNSLLVITLVDTLVGVALRLLDNVSPVTEEEAAARLAELKVKLGETHALVIGWKPLP